MSQPTWRKKSAGLGTSNVGGGGISSLDEFVPRLPGDYGEMNVPQKGKPSLCEHVYPSGKNCKAPATYAGSCYNHRPSR
jgi:hypothetical protein